MKTITEVLARYAILANSSIDGEFAEKQSLEQLLKEHFKKALEYPGSSDIFPLKFSARDAMSVKIFFEAKRSPADKNKILINSFYEFSNKVFYPTIVIKLETK